MDQQINEPKNTPSCGCDDNCCQPKKKTFLPKLIFSLIIIAAVSIILVKLFSPSTKAEDPPQQIFRDPSLPVWMDSTDKQNCDTTRSSSCCPK